MKSKQELRQIYLNKRRDFDKTARLSLSQRIENTLRHLAPLSDAETWLVYVSNDDGEVYTHNLIESLLAENCAVLVPLSQPYGILAWSRLHRTADLAPGTFGILEPSKACRELVTPPPSAPVLVPGIAYMREGYRIGYGGGYYDRFLSKHAGPSIGLAYESQLIDDFPREPSDRAVDWLVTEARVYDCRNLRNISG